MQGILLKLAGAGLLCLLYFPAVKRIVAFDRAKALVLSALGVGWAGCFAVFAVVAPLASYFRWSFQVLTAYVPGYYETGQAQRLQEIMAAQGIATAAGVLILGIAFILLGAVFLLLTRWRISSVSPGAPALFALAVAFDSERRAVTTEPSIIELLQRASFIDVTAMIAVVCIAAAGMVTLILGRRRLRLSARIVGYVVLFLGGFMVVAWVSLTGTINEMRPSMRFGEVYVSPADLANAIERGWMANYFFSWLMLVACVVVPVTCAVAMRRMAGRREPIDRKGSKAPLWGMLAALVFIAGAGVWGAWEDPYQRSLSRVVGAYYDEDGMASVKEHAERLDSDEGLAFLRESMYDHDQFFMHMFIMRHLWERSRHRRAKQAVLDMLCDTEQPAAALYARDIIVNNLWSDNLRDYYHLRRKEDHVSTLEMLTPVLMQEPRYGAKILRITIESRNANGGFFFDVMKVCARAGVTSFVLPEWRPHRGDEEYSLRLPPGFTIYYSRKPADKKGAVTIRFCWCEPGDPRLPDPSCLPGPVAFVADKQLPSVVDEMGQRRPEYDELIEILRAARAEAGGEAITPRLVIDSKMLSEQVMHLLNACAAAGVKQVSFVEP